MSNGRPLCARRLGTYSVEDTESLPLALDSTDEFFNRVPVAARPMSKPVMPSGSDGIIGLNDSAAPRSSDSERKSDCVNVSTVLISAASAHPGTGRHGAETEQG